MVIREKVYTAENLWELSHRPEYADKRLELSQGRLIVMSPAGWQHGDLTSRLGRIVGNFNEDSQSWRNVGRRRRAAGFQPARRPCISA